MTSVASMSMCRVRATPDTTGRAVEEAIQSFKHVLKGNGLESELQEFEKEDKIPPVDAVLTFTAQLDLANPSRRGRSIATRLHPVLESVRQYTAIVDTFVSSDPKIPALIWGSIKTTLKVIKQSGRSFYITKPGMLPLTFIEAIQKLWQAFRSFEEEFDGDEQEIQRQGDIVRVQIGLAKAKVDHQYQQMQAEEQKLLKRKLGKLGFSSRSQNARLDEIRLQQAKRESVGSGKTIASASSIQHILANKSERDFVTYHFFEQSLKLVTLSQDMVDELKKMEDEKFSSQSDLMAFLWQIVLLSEKFYIFLDGVDECELAQQHLLFDTLLSLVHSHKSAIRIFIFGREALAGEHTKRFPNLEQISMTSSEAKSDLGLYVESMILERCEKGMLATGDQVLLEEIQHVLTEHADGMFLWVTFLLDDLCAQYCDDDIRKCLKALPKNLRTHSIVFSLE
ncbi:unnamed protein product, partial [Clonostachys rhizophaga]